MKLFGESGTMYKALSCAKPKRTNRSGRTWDSKNKTIDEVEREFHYDSTWGQYMYFIYNGVWYKVSMESAYTESAFYTREDKVIEDGKKEEDRKNISFYNTLKLWNSIRVYENSKDMSLKELWSTVQSSNENFFRSQLPIMESFDDFISLVSTPNAAQRKIIAMFNGVYREKDLLNEK